MIPVVTILHLAALLVLLLLLPLLPADILQTIDYPLFNLTIQPTRPLQLLLPLLLPPHLNDDILVVLTISNHNTDGW